MGLPFQSLFGQHTLARSNAASIVSKFMHYSLLPNGIPYISQQITKFHELINVFFLYSDIYRSNRLITNFQQLLDNLFLPLFQATNNPEKHPELHWFLQNVINSIIACPIGKEDINTSLQLVGFDSVDDESKPEHPVFDREVPTPEQWTDLENPPYAYYVYYMYANICVLNQFRL